MKIQQMELTDFFEIKQHLPEFWGERYKILEPLHHPMLFYEFGKTAYVVKSEGTVVAYLFGMLPHASDTAYVHVLAVKPAHRKNAYARALYQHFMDYAKSQGYKTVKAITRPVNAGSIAFHRAIGMALQGEANRDGIPVVKDYSGPGEDRVVFLKSLQV